MILDYGRHIINIEVTIYYIFLQYVIDYTINYIICVAIYKTFNMYNQSVY